MMLGTSISGYTVLEKVGSGGMGVVYKARDSRLDRFVALKFLPGALAEDEEANARFVQEARAASALDHPNICTIHDIGRTDDGKLYTVGTFYEGSTIKDLLDAGKLPPQRAISIIRQIADGLDAAHAAGIIHRDIKPGNIIMATPQRPVLLDFGVAKLTGSKDITQYGSTIGTIHYMSPEQMDGRTVDGRADIWSLGVVLYQMITGRLPFEGDYTQAVMYAIMNNDLAPPDKFVSDLPPGLSDLVCDMLVKNPHERVTSAREVVERLGAIDGSKRNPSTDAFSASIASSDSGGSKPKQRRRLSAVMFTDMVGYSSMVQRDERLALDLLQEHKDLLRRIFPKHSGREIDTAGDAFFVEFGSALEATECAIEIQQTLHDRNTQVDPAKAIVLRVGLHLGDVVHVGSQVQGDGVNIAARMEPLAAPGSICVSEDVARQVHNKIDLPIAPLGKKALKNISLPMNAYRVVLPWESDFATTNPTHTFIRSRTVDRKQTRHRLRNWGILIAAAVAVVAAVLSFSKQSRLDGESPAGLSANVAAILPFSVQGSPELAYLGNGLVDLLSTKLDGAGDLRVVDPRAVLGAVAQAGREALDPAAGREIAAGLGAGTYVLGNVFEVGGRIQIDAALYREGSDRPVEQGSISGETSDIFSLIDGLAAQLLVVDRTGPGAPVERLEQMTTTSFTALKHYLQGVSAFRTARFQEAADELMMAVEEDSMFALAWYQLSSTADWLFDPDLTLTAAEHALRYKDRLSDRGRRLVEALYAGKIGSNRKALQLYRDFLTSYPEDVEAWYQLGELQFHSGPLIGIKPRESLNAWNEMLRFEPDQITALIHSARIYISEGNRAMLDTVSRKIIELEPAGERNLELRVHLALDSPDQSLPLSMASELREADDDMIAEVVWSLGAFRDHPGYAAGLTPLMADPTRSVDAIGLGHIIQGYLDVGRGKLGEAFEAFEQAERAGYKMTPIFKAQLAILPFRTPSEVELRRRLEEMERWDPDAAPPSEVPGVWCSMHDGIHEHLKYYLIGILSAKLGQYDRAIRSADWLETAPTAPQHGTLSSDLALSVRTEVTLQQGNVQGALATLDRSQRNIWYQLSLSSPISSQSRERFVRGQLLERTGKVTEAIEAMSFFKDFSVYDWAYAAPSHLLRARMFDEQGLAEMAAFHYRTFLDLWSDPDDEFVSLRDEAAQRLSSLEPE